MPIKSKTKDGYQIAYPGDSIDTAFSGQNSRRGRVGNQVAHTLTISATQAVFYLLPERENDRISHRPLTQSVKLVGRNESNEMDTRVHFIDLNPEPKLTDMIRESVTTRLNIREFSLKARILQMMKNSQLLLLNQTAKFTSAEYES